MTMTAVKRALGMGSYEVSYSAGSPLPIKLGARIVEANWPRDKALYARPLVDPIEIKEILSRPNDFTLVSPDPEQYQWEAENSARAFFYETYGVNSFKEVLEMQCPVDVIKTLMTTEEEERLRRVIKKMTENEERRKKEGPETWSLRMLTSAEAPDWQDYLIGGFATRREIPDYLKGEQQVLSAESMTAAAKDLLLHWPRVNHDGDFGGPPDYVQSGKKDLSLAEAFAAFAFVLEHFAVQDRSRSRSLFKMSWGPLITRSMSLRRSPGWTWKS